MSHFTVLVVTDEPGELPVAAALAPFQENNMGDVPEPYLEFTDNTDYLRNRWENEAYDMWQFPTKDHAEVWKASKPERREFYTLTSDSGEQYVAMMMGEEAEGLEGGWLNVPNKWRFATFEEFAEDYCGYEKDENGRYGYVENPNCKWDWWSIGGRWLGMLVPKPGASGMTGKPGVFGNETARPDAVDQCRFGDLDLEAMMEDRVSEAKNSYNRAVGKFNADLANPKVKKQWEEADTDTPFEEWVGSRQEFLYGLNPHLTTWEQYEAEVRARLPFSTFAVLKDGKWAEKGSMGSWGIATDEQDDWPAEFSHIAKTITADQYVTVVDCHI